MAAVRLRANSVSFTASPNCASANCACGSRAIRFFCFSLTPNKEGVFAGKCAELCGTYHSAMLFNVHIVSEADYNAYLKTLIAKGQLGEAKGNAEANRNGPADASLRGGER